MLLSAVILASDITACVMGFEKGTGMKEDKKQWILGYMLQHKNEPVDIVAESFVNAYIDRFHPRIVEWYPYGAPKVPEFGRLLAELYKENKVGRCRHRCENWQDGYPKWFYIYYLNGSRKRN